MVLRDWEHRFGARVVAVGFDTLHLSVAAPPMSGQDALLVAAEHFALSPDNIWQGSTPAHWPRRPRGSPAPTAGTLVGLIRPSPGKRSLLLREAIFKGFTRDCGVSGGCWAKMRS
ncbi:DUF4253 domain-containing protein [Streptomyces virginiae]|uniref:DUF4253 domain-containing protein n=1 Tax=Streptomyces virginiae TaxID=1961 RepID=UPI003F50F02E